MVYALSCMRVFQYSTDTPQIQKITAVVFPRANAGYVGLAVYMKGIVCVCFAALSYKNAAGAVRSAALEMACTLKTPGPLRL